MFLGVVVLRMLQVSILFPSGCGETLLLDELFKVGDLKLLAQSDLLDRVFCNSDLQLGTCPFATLRSASYRDPGIQDGVTALHLR